MKKVFLFILSIVICYSTQSQVLPKEFKLDVKISSSNTPLRSNFQIPKVLKNVLTVPVTSNLPLSNFVSDIIVVGDTIWFATGKGLSRTYNNGASFDNFYNLPPFGIDDIPGIAVYKNFVVVSMATTTSSGGQSDVPTGTGIRVSTDFGHNWSAYPQPKDLGPDSAYILYGYWGPQHIPDTIPALKVDVDQDNLSYAVLITRKNLVSDSIVIWIASWAGEIRKSTDYGATFQRVVLPPDGMDSITFYHDSSYTKKFTYEPVQNNNFKGFSLAAENDSTIYVGTADGINKSTDWGLSWRKYNYINTGNGSGISGNFVVSLAIQHYGLNTIIWGATDIGDASQGSGQQAGVSYSTNGGRTWANSLTDNAVFSHSLGFMDSIVYVCTDNGIWRSIFSPNNLSWAAPYIIYDETIRDQLKTSSFYAAASSLLNDTNFIWVGSGDGTARTFETGSPWVNKWKIFRARLDVASSSETYAAPNPFQPKLEFCRIFYKTGQPSANVTIKIFDFGMNYVRTLIQNAPRTGTNIQFTPWDGTRDDGKTVANGVYFYRIEIDKKTSAWGKILVLQ